MGWLTDVARPAIRGLKPVQGLRTELVAVGWLGCIGGNWLPDEAPIGGAGLGGTALRGLWPTGAPVPAGWLPDDADRDSWLTDGPGRTGGTCPVRELPILVATFELS